MQQATLPLTGPTPTDPPSLHLPILHYLFYNLLLYIFYRQKDSGSILWRCEYNNTYYRKKGAGCPASASTTGSSPTSTLEWARDHSHLPDNARISPKVICQQAKERAISEPTATPHLITTDSLQGVDDDVNLLVPLPKCLKRSLQRTRKAEAVTLILIWRLLIIDHS